MNRFLKAVLALACIVVLSTVSRAVWDSTTGNMNNNYELCWGLNYNACIYGSTVSNFVRIQTGGVDALTVNSSQVVTIPGSLAVTGTSTLTGNVAITGTLTTTGNSFAPLATYTTTFLAANPVPVAFVPYWVQESVGGTAVTNAYNLGMSTAVTQGSCFYVSVATSAGAKAGAVCSN